MNTESSPLPDNLPKRWPTWLIGMLMGDLVIGLLFGLSVFLQTAGSYQAILFPSFFLVPALGGIIASYFWRKLEPHAGQVVLNAFWMTLIALAGATIGFHEGIICLIIVAPIFYVMVLTGALLGRIWFRKSPPRLFINILPWMVLVLLAEPMTRSDSESVITDEIIIRAPPAKVWREVTSFPEIPTAPRFWLFSIGLPYPMATTTAGDFVNADRKCIFNHDAIFKEKVVELISNEKLTFEILESPRDPELVGHLTPHRGQFVLRRNANGTTTLVGSTWYTLHVRPLWYFDLWTQHIFRAVHMRVMQDVKRRAEL
ncbi:MAG: hypothetical protein ABIR24_08505 [Verrucomicrobiota bacterium]